MRFSSAVLLLALAALAATAAAAAPLKQQQQQRRPATTAAVAPLRKAFEDMAAVVSAATDAALSADAKRDVRAQDCADLECLQSCAEPITSFSSTCFPGIGGGSGSFDASAFASLFNGLGENVTNAHLETFCGCKGEFKRLLNVFYDVLSCVSSEFASQYDVSQYTAYIDDMYDHFLCVKNGDDYCAVLFNNAPRFSGFSSFVAGATSCPNGGPIIDYLGCCLRTYSEFLSTPRPSFGDDDDDDSAPVAVPATKTRHARDAEIGFDSEGRSEFDPEEFNDSTFARALTVCNTSLTSIDSCLAPGSSASYTRTTITFALDITTVFGTAGSDTYNARIAIFKVSLRRDFARATGLRAYNFQISRISSGSVVVEVDTLGDSAQAQLNSAISAGFPLTDTASELPAFSEHRVNSSTAATSTVEITAASTSPAPASVPAAAAAFAGVFALAAALLL